MREYSHVVLAAAARAAAFLGGPRGPSMNTSAGVFIASVALPAGSCLASEVDVGGPSTTPGACRGQQVVAQKSCLPLCVLLQARSQCPASTLQTSRAGLMAALCDRDERPSITVPVLLDSGPHLLTP